MKNKKIIVTFVMMLFIGMIFTNTALSLKEKKIDTSKNIFKNSLSLRDKISLDGEFNGGFHLLYHKTIIPGNYQLGMSFIRFKNADVNLNNGEIIDHGNGLLLVIGYYGFYDHDYDTNSITLDGKAWYVKLNMN